MAGHLIVVGLFVWLLVVIFAAMAERVPTCADRQGTAQAPFAESRARTGRKTSGIYAG